MVSMADSGCDCVAEVRQQHVTRRAPVTFMVNQRSLTVAVEQGRVKSKIKEKTAPPLMRLPGWAQTRSHLNALDSLEQPERAHVSSLLISSR